MNDESQKRPADFPTVRFPKRVVILGDDACAWMSATMLQRHCGRLGIQVTVCSHGPTVPGNFRTYSTTPALSGLLKNLGIDEHDLLRACRGTYKLATQYSDWTSEGRDFWQPIGMHSQRIEGLPLFDAWFSERKAGRLLRPLHSYAAHWTASLAGKSPHSFSATSMFAETGTYGFHVDAPELAEWFRKVALKSGVEEVPAPIAKVAPNGRGGVAQVVCDDGKAVPGDLFLDCRAVDAALRDSSSKDWTSWQAQFSCDRVATSRTPATRQVPVFTRLCGHENGWSRTVPLATEMEWTYAFDSQHESDREAGQRLRMISSPSGPRDDPAEAAIEFQSIHYGRRTKFWKDNVVNLGTAACRFAPVVSADLHLQQAGIELLLELFPDRKIGRATRAEYNARMASIADEAREAAQLTHVMRRSSVAQSQHATEAMTDVLQQALSLYDACGVVNVTNAESMAAEEIRWFLAGCGRLPDRPALSVRAVDPNQIPHGLREALKRSEAIVKELPLHEELLDWIHTGPFQQSVG
ncbi:MAG: tryptophan 7-halogenase [Fuerstiella sp.]|nr:tryptophan 7-halogenase [Fuerstiella sp.]